MSKSIKEFAEKVAEELVVEYKFSSDRAILAVKGYARMLKIMFQNCEKALKKGANESVYADTIVEAARSILGEMGLNMSSDYKRKLLSVRVILAEKYGWDEVRTYGVITRSDVILLKMVMRGFTSEAIAEILAANNVLPGEASLSATSLPTSEPWSE